MGKVADYTDAARCLGWNRRCDETAAAVLRGDGTMLAEAVLSQLKEHTPFGGVVPEIAARAHLAAPAAAGRAGDAAEPGWASPSWPAVAASAGPGLIGGLIVGSQLGKGIAICRTGCPTSR